MGINPKLNSKNREERKKKKRKETEGILKIRTFDGKNGCRGRPSDYLNIIKFSFIFLSPLGYQK